MARVPSICPLGNEPIQVGVSTCQTSAPLPFQTRLPDPFVSRHRSLKTLCLLLLAVGALQGWWPTAAQGDQAPRLTQLSLEELGNIQVTSVSKEPEQVRKTPAAIYVITEDDIRRSGATSLPGAMRLAPGVEVTRVDSDHWAVGIRGGFSNQATGSDRWPKCLHAPLWRGLLERPKRSA